MDWGKYFPILDYYAKEVVPLGNKYRRKKKGLRVCPLHEDHDPSFGVINTSNRGEIYHCFGCNSYGDVINLHMRLRKMNTGIILDRESAKKELCQIFNIKYESLPKEEEDMSDYSEDRYVRRSKAIKEAIDSFNLDDYAYLVTEGKVNHKDLSYFNALMVRMMEASDE